MVLDSFQAGQSETGPVYDFATSTPLATREETRQFVALADELAQQRPDALLRYPPAGAAAASGRAQHLLRRSYVGCPREQIPEGIHCIDWEIDWLLEHQAALEI